MTTQEIARMIEGVGLPYAYDHFDEAEAPAGPPYLCFTYPETSNFMADGAVYAKIATLRVELYTDTKDLALERSVEAALEAAGLCYDYDETWIEQEQMHLVTWIMDVVITQEEE